MSWHISLALAEAFANSPCSPGAVSASSAANSSAGAPSAPSNGKSMPAPSSRPAKMTAASRRSLFGTMFAPSTDDRGEALLMWFLADSRARTSVLPVPARASMATAPDSGAKWPASSAKYDPASRSWKTHQLSLTGDWESYSETWPRWGTMRAGEFWEQPTPERRTSATESGSLQRLPTLVKRDGARVDCPAEHRRNSPPLIAMLSKFPTLVASDTGCRKKKYAQGGTPLSLAVQLFPTLTVSGNYNRKGASPQSGDGLATALAKMPTLTCQDAKNCGGPSQMNRNSPPLNALAAGPLNPEWCELFMGCPLGWTSLDPLPRHELDAWKRGFSPYPNHDDTPTRYGAEAWSDGSWESGIPRMVRGTPLGVDRIEGLGNGQVPACVLLACVIVGEIASFRNGDLQ